MCSRSASASVAKFGARAVAVMLEFGQRNAEDFCGRENDGALDEVFEFAHVAGPVIAFEGRQGFGRDGLDVAIHAPRILLRKIANQRGDVLAALAQRRHDHEEKHSCGRRGRRGRSHLRPCG